MRILYLGNNWVGLEVLKWLKGRGDEIAGLVVHPPEQQRHAEAIVQASGVPSPRVFLGSCIHEPSTQQAIAALAPDLGVSVLFGYRLKPEILRLFPRGVINLHPSLLPYNRGEHPNIWSIVDRTPAGVSLHYVNEELDAGDLIAQREVPVGPTDTGASLYRKLEHAAVALFQDTWPRLKEGHVARIAQDATRATFHKARDVDAIDAIDLDRSYRARDLINILRARTFPPYKGAYVTINGRRIYLRLELEAEAEDGRHD